MTSPTARHAAFLTLLGLAASSAVLAAWAQAPSPVASPATLWQCWLQPDQQVGCTLVQVGARPQPSPPGLPPVVVALRERPASALGRVIRIPLHTEPFDTASVAELAQAVMCGTQPACRTQWLTHPGATAEAAAALADAHDPVLAAR